MNFLNRRFFILTFICLFLSLAAQAEEPKPLFTPTSGWLVGPASLTPREGTESRMPCLMMNQYENGFAFRFAGGGKRILATAIDFRQAAFTAGAHYPLTLGIPPSFDQKLDAVAYNEAILIINLKDAKPAQDLYAALSQGQEIHLGFGKKIMDFALLGTSDGLRRMESCYDPAAAAAPAPEMKAVEQQASPAPPEDNAGPKVDSLIEKTTENLQQMPSPQTSPPLAQPPANPNAAPLRWDAGRGMNLRETLDGWARRANANIIWKAKKDFRVHDSISALGSFEQAAQSLLEQYNNDKVRPVGHIYKDPESGKPVLLLEQDGD
jgi:hypothetical protein